MKELREFLIFLAGMSIGQLIAFCVYRRQLKNDRRLKELDRIIREKARDN
jgi:hypothetical protein